MRLRQILTRALKLRCPRCGRGRLFLGRFTMYEACPACGLHYQREPGFYLGSIYFNYGATALIVTAVYLALFAYTDLTQTAPRLVLAALTMFCVAFPLLFFRHARSLWLGWDQFADPQPAWNESHEEHSA